MTTPHEPGRLALLMDFEPLLHGVAGSEAAGEGTFAFEAVVAYLESAYGPVIRRYALADWSSAPCRAHAPELARLGVVMQHVVHHGVAGRAGSAATLVLEAIDCLLHYPAIDTFVLAPGDADVLPLVFRLKACGKRVIGLGPERGGDPAFMENCDPYLCLGANGLAPWTVGTPAAAGPADTRAASPSAGSDDDRRAVSAGLAFAEYMTTTRWFIADAALREQVLARIYEELSSQAGSLTLDELRRRLDLADEATDKEWFGTLFSLIHGGCLWEDPATSEKPLALRGVSLFRGILDLSEFLTRYYCSLFHKAFAERPDISPAVCSDLMYRDRAPAHLALLAAALGRLAERR